MSEGMDKNTHRVRTGKKSCAAKGSETLIGELYRLQLKRIQEKWPKQEERCDKIIFHHDNAQPPVTKRVKNSLDRLRWKYCYSPPNPDCLLW
ncbi:hypothetical protein CEXT_124741 [Caerostris extrusa]|uniref:Uncharacterized protein n=1 Tax=Caerostris extrusa TaxID=172846 RepID=A0AAV4R8C7_CAEEX|nr:hypothetical protein CEXT_124741 [Caerostris extrusa]